MIGTLRRMGASPAAWASLVQADERTSRAWASGKTRIPPAVATLARVADGVGAKMAYGELAALLRAEADRLEA